MSLAVQTIRAAAAGLLIALAACGGGDDESGAPPASAVVGAAGGTVTGPNGAKVEIPPGALGSDTTIAIEATSAGSPLLPDGFSVAGRMFAFTPHGTTFKVPVTVTLPFDPASVPAGRTPALYKTTGANQWLQVPGASFGSTSVTAQITSFSWVQVNGLLRSDPVRVWEFGAFPGSGGAEVSFGGATQVGGLLEQLVDFGAGLGDIDIVALTQTVPADNKARGYIFGTPDGVTYGVYAEAPFAKRGGSEPIGGIARLEQTRSFIKLSPDATLTFTLTGALISASDASSRGGVDDLISGELFLEVHAYTSSRSFFHTAGGATVTGSSAQWVPEVWNYRFSRTPLWSESDFQFDAFNVVDPRFAPCGSARADLDLKRSRSYTVDLSSIAVGEEFTLKTFAFAKALNRRGGGAAGDCEASAALAYLRDPLEIGGTTVSFSGLQPTDNPLLQPPVETPVVPAACVPGPGPDPSSGTLQFSAARYAIGEFAGATPTVRVTRSGGSRGAVTATFATSDGSALAGADYTAVNVSVFFADGDATPRAVEVPIVVDRIVEPDKTVNLTLSQPGGCAALGAQTTAVLTIVDDDTPPPATLPTGMDTSFGSAGKATLERFGGDRSGMALQADGKIVMVGGTFVDFILARFNADGSIDRSFGVDGKVTTDMGSGLRQEEALAVAIQSDGKIVVVGQTAIDAAPPSPDLPATFAIARYQSDGSLDTGFGTGGRVSGSVNGIARAVAIQADGKIVLAGDFELQLSNGVVVSDIVVARFNANGSLDLAFGTSGTGQVATDIGGAANSGRNLVLQPNGAIVVSGTPQCGQPGCLHTDVVRYNANGTLDASFGNGGKLTLADVDVGQGLVRQADGKLVLVGTVTQPVAPATARFVLMRRNGDGSPDPGFGSAGTASTLLSENAVAHGIALQADGKLVVVGTRAFTANPNFIVARYASNGALDTGFANAGILSIDFFGGDDVGENVLVQPDGRIVVGGQARNVVDGYGLARINP